MLRCKRRTRRPIAGLGDSKAVPIDLKDALRMSAGIAKATTSRTATPKKAGSSPSRKTKR